MTALTRGGRLDYAHIGMNLTASSCPVKRWRQTRAGRVKVTNRFKVYGGTVARSHSVSIFQGKQMPKLKE